MQPTAPHPPPRSTSLRKQGSYTLIPHVVQTEADKVFVNILNTQAVSVTDGDAVVWDVTSPDGVRTTQPATATLGLFVGLVDGTIAASAYGLAQAYGYKAVGLVSTDTDTGTAGDILTCAAAVDYLVIAAATGATTYLAAATPGAGWVFAAENTTTTITSQNLKVFIRAL